MLMFNSTVLIHCFSLIVKVFFFLKWANSYLFNNNIIINISYYMLFMLYNYNIIIIIWKFYSSFNLLWPFLDVAEDGRNVWLLREVCARVISSEYVLLPLFGV